MAEEKLDWGRVGEAISQARVLAGHGNQEDAADASGIGVTTWRQIENAKQTYYRPSTLAAFQVFFGWGAGTIMSIARGGPIPEMGGYQIQQRFERLESRMADVDSRLDQIIGAVRILLAPGAIPEPAASGPFREPSSPSA